MDLLEWKDLSKLDMLSFLANLCTKSRQEEWQRYKPFRRLQLKVYSCSMIETTSIYSPLIGNCSRSQDVGAQVR